jgi:hypothetical protein
MLVVHPTPPSESRAAVQAVLLNLRGLGREEAAASSRTCLCSAQSGPSQTIGGARALCTDSAAEARGRRPAPPLTLESADGVHTSWPDRSQSQPDRAGLRELRHPRLSPVNARRGRVPAVLPAGGSRSGSRSGTPPTATAGAARRSSWIAPCGPMRVARTSCWPPRCTTRCTTDPAGRAVPEGNSRTTRRVADGSAQRKHAASGLGSSGIWSMFTAGGPRQAKQARGRTVRNFGEAPRADT